MLQDIIYTLIYLAVLIAIFTYGGIKNGFMFWNAMYYATYLIIILHIIPFFFYLIVRLGDMF